MQFAAQQTTHSPKRRSGLQFNFQSSVLTKKRRPLESQLQDHSLSGLSSACSPCCNKSPEQSPRSCRGQQVLFPEMIRSVGHNSLGWRGSWGDLIQAPLQARLIQERSGCSGETWMVQDADPTASVPKGPACLPGRAEQSTAGF